jgi:hypothetical protein
MRGALPCWTEDRYLTVRPSHCSGVCLTAAAFELRERKLAAAEKAARLLSAIRWRCTMASAVCSGTTMAAASAFGSTGIGPPTVRLGLTPTIRAGAPTPARLNPLTLTRIAAAAATSPAGIRTYPPFCSRLSWTQAWPTTHWQAGSTRTRCGATRICWIAARRYAPEIRKWCEN